MVASFAPLLQGREQGIISCARHNVFCLPFLLPPLVWVLLTLFVLLTGLPASHHCFYIEFIVAFIAGRVGFIGFRNRLITLGDVLDVKRVGNGERSFLICGIDLGELVGAHAGDAIGFAYLSIYKPGTIRPTSMIWHLLAKPFDHAEYRVL